MELQSFLSCYIRIVEYDILKNNNNLSKPLKMHDLFHFTSHTDEFNAMLNLNS